MGEEAISKQGYIGSSRIRRGLCADFFVKSTLNSKIQQYVRSTLNLTQNYVR